MALNAGDITAFIDAADAYTLSPLSRFSATILQRKHRKKFTIKDSKSSRATAEELARRYFNGRTKTIARQYESDGRTEVALTKLSCADIQNVGRSLKRNHQRLPKLAAPNANDLVFGVSTYAHRSTTNTVTGAMNSRIGANDGNSLIVEVPMSAPGNDFAVARIRLDLKKFIAKLLKEANPKPLKRMFKFLYQAGVHPTSMAKRYPLILNYPSRVSVPEGHFD